MLALGFSSGLPFLLTGNTFGYWLRDGGTSLKAIGFISWVGLAYFLKFLWSPIVDRVDLPLFGRLGRRRGWMLFAQVLVAAGLVGMSVVGVGHGLVELGAFAVLVAFASATKDISIDAWRIEAASDSDEFGLMTSAAQLGYRMALWITDARDHRVSLPRRLAGVLPRHGCGYGGRDGGAAFFAFEPARAEAALDAKAPLWTPRGLFGASSARSSSSSPSTRRSAC